MVFVSSATNRQLVIGIRSVEFRKQSLFREATCIHLISVPLKLVIIFSPSPIENKPFLSTKASLMNRFVIIF